MSESNLTDKISESITNVFKKTEVFEKIEKVEFFINSFIIVSSIFGLTSIYINYCNLNKIKNLEEKIRETKDILKHSIEINLKQNLLSHENTITKLLENQNLNILLLQEEKQLEFSKKELISTSTSTSSLLPLKIIIPHENDDLKNNIIKQEEIEDNELINECYDSIPLNNLKKNTGLSWLFK